MLLLTSWKKDAESSGPDLGDTKWVDVERLSIKLRTFIDEKRKKDSTSLSNDDQNTFMVALMTQFQICLERNQWSVLNTLIEV